MTRWFRLGLSVTGPFGGRCLTSLTMLRFHTPLIKLDGRFSRIQLSDKVAHTFAHEPFRLVPLELVQAQLLIQVWVGVSSPAPSRHLELRAQPLTYHVHYLGPRSCTRLPRGIAV